MAPPAPPRSQCKSAGAGGAAQAATEPHSDADDIGRQSWSHAEPNQTSPKFCSKSNLVSFIN